MPPGWITGSGNQPRSWGKRAIILPIIFDERRCMGEVTEATLWGEFPRAIIPGAILMGGSTQGARGAREAT